MIQYTLFDDMEVDMAAEVDRLLPLVSEQRRNYVLRMRPLFSRFASLKAMELLAPLLPHKPALSELTFDFNAQGKPFLKERPDCHFSISHCKRAILVVTSDRPVGVDVECFREVKEALIRRTMNAAEVEDILRAPCRTEAFLCWWTRKEAVLKCKGTGILEDLRTVLSGTELIETHAIRSKQYVFSICNNL